MSETSSVIPISSLIADYADWKYGSGKILAIIRSTIALLSTISSSILIRIIAVSEKRLTTTYHRLLLGMSISDIVLSLSIANFNAMMPRDLSYLVWNARGNMATCSSMGFLTMVGAFCAIFYICSINLFYLAKVKYNQSDMFISSKIEPWLHCVPILLALVPNLTFLAKNNFNDDGDGTCTTALYNPPHCIGYADGQVREGFEIPCGRGNDGLPTFNQVMYLIALVIPPIIIGISLGMIYREVQLQEKRMARYGTSGTPNENNPTDREEEEHDDSKGDNERSTTNVLKLVGSSVKSWFERRKPATSTRSNSHRRVVMQRAFAYTSAYFLTWIWTIIIMVLLLAGVWEWNVDSASTNGELAFRYFWNIFTPCQGVFNLFVFIVPQVMKERQSSRGNISWHKAFGKAFRSSLAVNKSTATHDNTHDNAPDP